jgi:3-hydroxyisobutyrate dehydrogenase-like beta-hydroxyacid dehydrogenase
MTRDTYPEQEAQRIAFIGLGTMGYPMAGHLKRAGHTVTVFNRSTTKAEAWVAEYGGAMAKTPREAAQGCDFVITCVGNDDDLRSVLLGDDGAFAGMSEGALLMDHTTASAAIARELDALCLDKGIYFVDAPVSGGQSGAVNGQLAVMCGGDHDAVAAARPIAQCYGKSVTWIGDAGCGQLAKMVNQICVAGLLQGLSEALAFGKKANLNMDVVLSVISQGAAQSWQMQNRGPTMLQDQFDFGFAVDWMRKDLALVLEEAGRNGAQLPVTALVDQFYAEVQAMGGGRWDTSSLIKRLT